MSIENHTDGTDKRNQDLELAGQHLNEINYIKGRELHELISNMCFTPDLETAKDECEKFRVILDELVSVVKDGVKIKSELGVFDKWEDPRINQKKRSQDLELAKDHLTELGRVKYAKVIGLISKIKSTKNLKTANNTAEKLHDALAELLLVIKDEAKIKSK